MLSNYSSLLEFMAGVYLTMCLDNILTQKIWSVDYFAAFKHSLEELSFGGNKSIASEVVDQNRDQISVMQAKLTKKSVYMLSYIFLLLYTCGVEADCHPEISGCSLYLFVFLQSFVTLITLCFSERVFSKWSNTFKVLVLSLIFVTLISNLNLPVYWFSKIDIPVYIIVYSVLFLVVYPIFWQLFKVWVYRSLFYDYINNEMIKVSNEYNMVLHILQNGGDTSKLPQEYGQILQNNTIKHKKDKAQKAIDDSITDYTNLLQVKLRKIGYETTIIAVLWASLFNKNEVLRVQVQSGSSDESLDKEENELSNYKKK